MSIKDVKTQERMAPEEAASKALTLGLRMPVNGRGLGRTGRDHPGDSPSSSRPRAVHPLAMCRPACALRGMGLDRVQRDAEARANLPPRDTSRDASQHREAGRAGFLDALRFSAYFGRSSEFAAGRSGS